MATVDVQRYDVTSGVANMAVHVNRLWLDAEFQVSPITIAAVQDSAATEFAGALKAVRPDGRQLRSQHQRPF